MKIPGPAPGECLGAARPSISDIAANAEPSRRSELPKSKPVNTPARLQGTTPVKNIHRIRNRCREALGCSQSREKLKITAVITIGKAHIFKSEKKSMDIGTKRAVISGEYLPQRTPTI